MSNKKNILLCDFDDIFWVDIFKEIEKKLNLRIHTIIDDKEKMFPELRIKNINCNFIDIRDAIKGIGLKKYEKKTNEKFLKKKIDKYKPFLIDMMSRFDPDGCSFNDIDRAKHIKKLFIIWYNYLKKEKINIFFCKYTPHQVYDYIIYICCKILKIKVVFFNYTYFENLSFLNNDPDNRIINNKLKSSTSLNNVKKYINEKKRKINLPFKSGAPNYIKQNKLLKPKFFSLIYFLSRIILKTILSVLKLEIYKNSFYQFKKKNIKFSKKIYFSNLDFFLYKIRSLFIQFEYTKFYKSLERKLPKKFVYFASNHQPEASSNSECGINFYDQYKAIKFLNDNLPNYYYIVYKEHPSSFNPLKFGYQKRSLKYYKKISSLSKVVFINSNYDSFELIRKSDFVITISGQIGFEALCKKTKTMIFSNTWYSDFANIFKAYPISEFKKIPFKRNNFNKFDWSYFEKKLKKCLDSSVIRAQDSFLKLNIKKINKEKKIISSYIINNFNKI